MKTSNGVLDAIVKLPRHVSVESTLEKKMDETNAVVLVTNTVKDSNNISITKESKSKSKYSYKNCHKYYLANKKQVLDQKHRYYLENRDKILQQKKAHNAIPEVKAKRAIYSKEYHARKRLEKQKEKGNRKANEPQPINQ